MIEFECSVCEGKGIIYTNGFVKRVCSNCSGTGKVDWIDNIVPRNKVIIWGQKTLESRTRIKNGRV